MSRDEALAWLRVQAGPSWLCSGLSAEQAYASALYQNRPEYGRPAANRALLGQARQLLLGD